MRTIFGSFFGVMENTTSRALSSFLVKKGHEKGVLVSQGGWIGSNNWRTATSLSSKRISNHSFIALLPLLPVSVVGPLDIRFERVRLK